ncbi:MAG: hypothetical protein ACQERN_00475 [Thermodesulfobacteriota bacterium]
MKIVFIHYHLKPGGVTTVIRQQIAALQHDCDLLVLTGEPPLQDLGAPHVQINGLGYDDPSGRPTSPAAVAAAIESAIYQKWPGGCDLVHIHNPLLAKNRHFPAIIEHLRNRDMTVFLQIHDFAEDGRPDAYFAGLPYPPDCHYGVINSRDARILKSAGLAEEGVHLLFNMVEPFFAKHAEPDEGWVVYPVRAIRRKNIGEALLLSLYFREGQRLAITLPPNSPRDRHIYKTWKSFAAEYRFNVLFEAARTHDFRQLVASAACLVTTSINEGFGFAFLEPWTAKKAVIGRNLPQICSDFAHAGICLDHLYDRLAVPADWIDMDAFYARWHDCIRNRLADYGMVIADKDIQKGYQRLICGHTVDFAVLDEYFQKKVIQRLTADPGARQAFMQCNPCLATLTAPPLSRQQVEGNDKAVRQNYNMAAYRSRLHEVYHRVTTVCVRHRIDKTALLRAFLDPETFGMLKWC